MRVIAGEHKGRTLKAPNGQGTRPTGDRVRESLMSAIHSRRGGFQDAVVLDVFAGSGALGIEALSRGAAFAQFCEKDPSAVRVVRANVASLNYGRDRARVLSLDVLKTSVPAASKPYDLIFLDPPYALEAGEVFDLLGRLMRRGAIAESALIVYEHSSTADQTVEALADATGLSLVFHRQWRDTVLDMMELPDSGAIRAEDRS